MSKGVLLYALNNEQIDYTKIAYYAAKQAKKHLKVPVALITDSGDWLATQFPDYKDVFDMVIKIVYDTTVEPWRSNKHYGIGSLVFYNGTIWRKVKNGNETVNVKNKNNYKALKSLKTYFEPIYEGIEVDRWYSNLPYLKGQHVLHNQILYRCNTNFEEQEEFTETNYDIITENVLDIEDDPQYIICDKILYNRKLYAAKKNRYDKFLKEFIETDFEAVYTGIDIDKWYPNLPYLKGQHVWYEDCLYKCEIGYTEENNFSVEKYSIVLEDVKDLEQAENFQKGDILLYKRSLWSSKANHGYEYDNIGYDLTDLEPVYQGIDIDKWYPNLPYLTGQHVWYENTLYRCNTDYKEQEEFSIDKYDCLLENVYDLDRTEKFVKGTILLYDRTLWMSTVNYDSSLDENKIRDDIWQDTKERHLVWDSSIQYRKYFDGSLTYKRLKFKNDIRIRSFQLSPFDETLVIDCDYFINNDTLKYCWEQPHDFLIFKNATDLSGYRNDPRLKSVSDKSIDFYWATVFFFRKNSNTEIFFNYLGHIQENWNYYRHIYQIDHSLYRNDYAFSIAIHVMNGYQKGNWAYSLPGKLYYTTDRDLLIDYKNRTMKFLIEKQNYKGEYTLIKIDNLNLHVMNKFSLSRILDDIHNVEHSL